MLSVESGSIQFNIGGSLFASGIALLVGSAAGLIAAPIIGGVAGSTLATVGFIEVALGWKEQIARIRKTESETRLQQLQIETKELELELARKRAEDATDAQSENRNYEDLAWSSLVPRELVQREAERLGLSEGYANYPLNITVPTFSKLEVHFKKVEVHYGEEREDLENR